MFFLVLGCLTGKYLKMTIFVSIKIPKKKENDNDMLITSNFRVERRTVLHNYYKFGVKHKKLIR